MLIGTSGKGKTFTKEVVEAMSSINSVLFFSFYRPFLCHMIHQSSRKSQTQKPNYGFSAIFGDFECIGNS